MSARALADACRDAGYPDFDRSIIANLEAGRRRTVSVDELLVLAFVLDVAPVDLLVPDSGPIQVGSWTIGVGPRWLRQWVRGDRALHGQDKRRFEAARPLDVDVTTAAPGEIREALERVMNMLGPTTEGDDDGER